MRRYGWEQLQAEGELERARQCHAGWCLALAERAEPELTRPEQERWLARLEREHDNLRAALDWLLATPARTADGLRLAGALWRFWEARGHLTEGRGWLERALTAPPEALGPTRAKALAGAGALARLQGDAHRAEAAYEESLAHSRAADDRWAVAAALTNLGTLAKDRGNFPAAVACFEEGIALFRHLTDQHGLAAALATLGNLLRAQGQFERASALYGESLALHRALGDRRGVAALLNNLGAVAADQQDHARAAARYRESLAICQAMGDPRGFALTLTNLAVAARQQGDLAEAARLLARALPRRRELGDRPGIAVCLEELALAAAAHQPERMARLLGAAEAVREAAGVRLPPHQQQRLERLAAAAQGRTEVDRACLAWQTGLQMTLDEAIGEALGNGAGDDPASGEPPPVALTTSAGRPAP